MYYIVLLLFYEASLFSQFNFFEIGVHPVIENKPLCHRLTSSSYFLSGKQNKNQLCISGSKTSHKMYKVLRTASVT